MPSTYTSSLGIELIATGEQDGTWGDTTNTNWDMMDQAIVGQADVTLVATGSTGAPNTLVITDGALSDGRNQHVNYIDGGDLGGTVYVQLGPNDVKKIGYFTNNLTTQDIVFFQGTYNAGRAFTLLNGNSTVLQFDGQGASASTASSLTSSIAGITGTKAEFDTACTDGDFAYDGGAFHDGFSDYVANQHIDWTSTSSNFSTSGTLGCGALTSTGINDDATSERMKLGDTQLLLGTVFSTGDYAVKHYGDGTGQFIIDSGGTGGAQIQLNGPSHADAGDIYLGTAFAFVWELHYDNSAGEWDFKDNDITTSGAIAGSNLSGSNTGDNPGVTSVTGGTGLSSTGGDAPSISHDAHTGDVTGSTALTIGALKVATGMVQDDAITYAKMQNVVADERILGRVSGAGGVVEELTAAQVLTMLGISASDFGKHITIESPSAAEDVTWFFTNVAITLSEIRAVLTGSSTPSVTWTMRHGTDRSATGTVIDTNTTTSVTSGDDITSITDPTIPADSFVWLETTAISGTVNSLHLTTIGSPD